MKLSKLANSIMKDRLNLVIFLCFVGMAFTVLFNFIPFNKDKTVTEPTPTEKMFNYAVNHNCSRHINTEGVAWWLCDTGWWQEIELHDIANGKYHTDGSEPKPQEKTGVENGSTTTS